MGENTVELTKDNFDEIIYGEKPVIVDFWAEWCGPCRSIAPLLEKFAGEHEEVVVGKVNIEDQTELTSKYGIRSLPTFALFREGKLVATKVGMQSNEQLLELIKEEK